MLDLAGLSLFPATPEQLLESRKRTHPQWSRGLSLEQYLKRDYVMDLEPHATDGKLITWVLAPRTDPTTLDFFCSCETYRRTGIIAHPSSTSATAVPGYGIASVFTPPHHRRRGYAAHMMRLLHWVLAPPGALCAPFPAAWAAPPESPLRDAVFAVLYSDIGRDFYARCGPVPGTEPGARGGWEVVGAVSTQWDVPQEVRASEENKKRWKWLSREECINVWKQDAELMKADAVALAQSKGKTVYTFLPDQGVGQFSIQRLMTFDENLQPVYPLEPWGVQLLAGPDEPLAFATWTFEPGTTIMVLTRLRCTPEQLPILLEALKFKAREIGFDVVETWGIPDSLRKVGEGLGSRTVERVEHLSATKWYGEEPEDSVEWIFNEKFCWC